MKRLMFLTFIVAINSYCNAQIIIDFSQESFYGDTKNGSYYHKDINNYMSPYIGTWKYVYGNKEFRITLTKVTKYHDVFPLTNDNYYKDAFYITYQKYENGQLVYNSPQDEYPTGIIKEFGKLNMSFTDYERNNETFPVDLILIPIGNNQYNLKFRLDMFEKRNTYFEQHPNEPYFSVPNNIVMTKQ